MVIHEYEDFATYEMWQFHRNRKRDLVQYIEDIQHGHVRFLALRRRGNLTLG